VGGIARAGMDRCVITRLQSCQKRLTDSIGR
jgi:hypothetical protein